MMAAVPYPAPPPPPGWPVSTVPYGYAPVPDATPKRGRAPLVILSVLSTVLLLGLGVLTVLYVNDRNTITQQRGLINSNAADLSTKSAELARTKQDLDAANRDLETEKACADSVRNLYKQAQSLQTLITPSADPQSVLNSSAFQAMEAAERQMQDKCGLK